MPTVTYWSPRPSYDAIVWTGQGANLPHNSEPELVDKLNIVAVYAISVLVCGVLIYATYVDFLR